MRIKIIWADIAVGPQLWKVGNLPPPLILMCLRRTLQHYAVDERGQRDIDDGIQAEAGR